MLDLLIKNCTIYPKYQKCDIGIFNGKIVLIDGNITCDEVSTVLDAQGMLVTPSFVDGHIHIDKAFLGTGTDYETEIADASGLKAIEGEELVTSQFKDLRQEDIVEDIVRRASKAIEMGIVNGTGAMKTNILINDNWKFASFEATKKLKKKYKSFINLQNVVWYDKKWDNEWRKWATDNEIDFIGGWNYAGLDQKTGKYQFLFDYKKDIDTIFELAKEYHIPIDVHCDENDIPKIDCFRYICKKTGEANMGGRVTCAHITSMDVQGLSESIIEDAINEGKAAGVNVSTQTSCNMYLSSMHRRGPTRVRQMLEAGINISIGSDNIRDPFRPFGNVNLLEEALLTAQVHKFGTNKELEKVFRMISYNPAKSALLNNYGTEVGCEANLVILDAPNVEEAVLSQVRKAYVLYQGNVVAKDGRIYKSIFYK